MMAHSSTAWQYQQTQVGTADRRRLLMLMFDGALKFLALAEARLREGDIGQFAHHLSRAEGIIAELLHTLDHKAGGEIAKSLERLYRFMLEHLTVANLRKSAGHVAEVARVLGVVASAYREIAERPMPETHAV